MATNFGATQCRHGRRHGRRSFASACGYLQRGPQVVQSGDGSEPAIGTRSSSIPAQTGPSHHTLTPQCSFLEADINQLAQHLGRLDD